MTRKTSRIMDRLKVLPLTLLLSVLLWLYADANLTSTENDLPIHIAVIAAPDAGSRTVQLARPVGGDFQISIQGPRNRVQRVRQQCEGRAVFTTDDLSNLVYVVRHPGRLAIGRHDSLDAVKVFNSLPFFRQRRINVISVKPARLQLNVDEMVAAVRPIDFRQLRGVPVTVSPPTAKVVLPRSLLASIGGKSQIRVIAHPLVDPTTLPPNTRQTIQAQLVAHYPGTPSNQVTVFPSTATVTLNIPAQPRKKLFIGIVPVWVSGPPWLLSRYTITTRPTTVNVTVSGSAHQLALLRTNEIKGNAAPVRRRVIAMLHITATWQPADAFVRRRIHYRLPAGISLIDGPRHILCRIVNRTAAATTAPLQASGANSQPAAAATYPDTTTNSSPDR